MAAIVVEKLTKTFRVRQRRADGTVRLGHLFARRPARQVPAVTDLSFEIAAGERVAFIGPNGAGKSTTLKILTGILDPTFGHAEVAQLVPWRRRRELAMHIGIVFGQRSQLWYHLPVRASLDLLAAIYSIEHGVYLSRLARLAESFEIVDLLDRPVSQLSLGQRIRAEIVAALLHGPTILLLDEPTIGLDVTAKAALRDHLNALSREERTTVLLTSHDTGDIERICERVILIDRGRLLLDLPLESLRRDFLKTRSIVLATDEEHPKLDLPGVTAVAQPYRLTLAVDVAVTPIERVVEAALARLSLRDIVIENPPLEATNPLGLLGSVLLYWLILGIFWGLWSATPLHELGSAELTEDRLLAYLAVTEWIAFAVGLPYREVEAEIQSGTIDMRIARPIPFGLATLAIWIGEVSCRLVVLGFAGLAALSYASSAIALTLPTAALLVLSVAFSALLILLWHLQIGYAAAWLGMSAPTFWVWQKCLFVLGGLIMPLTIYPASIGAIAKASPFAAMLFAPGSLMLQDGPAHAARALALQLAWLTLSTLAAVAVERGALRRFAERGI